MKKKQKQPMTEQKRSESGKCASETPSTTLPRDKKTPAGNRAVLVTLSEFLDEKVSDEEIAGKITKALFGED